MTDMTQLPPPPPRTSKNRRRSCRALPTLSPASFTASPVVPMVPRTNLLATTNFKYKERCLSRVVNYTLASTQQMNRCLRSRIFALAYVYLQGVCLAGGTRAPE